MIFLDTHVAIWLCDGTSEQLSNAALAMCQSNEHLVLSPMTVLELQLLHEIDKVNMTPDKILSFLEKTLKITVQDDSWHRSAQIASLLTWTRDPFDRLLVAQAQLNRAKIITKDRLIRKHYARVVW
jgi:PIN domain nuclease of toxin-antitoxin system